MSKKITDKDGNTYVQKKPFYKRFWFWILAIIVIFILGTALGGNSDNSNNGSTSSTKKVDGITKSQFNAIKLSENDGTSLKNTEKQFGKKPSSTSTDTIDGIKSDMNTWDKVANGDLGSAVTVGFSNNHAISKSIDGLKVKRANKITLSDFNSISNGMSKDNIKNKFGEPNGYSITSISGITSEDWSYTSDIKGDTGANFIITFQNDAVSGKTQTDMK